MTIGKNDDKMAVSATSEVVELYRVYESVTGGVTLERASDCAGSDGELYEFRATSDDDAARIYAAFEAGFEARADAEDAPTRTGFSMFGVLPLDIMVWAFCISLSFLALTGTAWCVYAVLYTIAG